MNHSVYSSTANAIMDILKSIRISGASDDSDDAAAERSDSSIPLYRPLRAFRGHSPVQYAVRKFSTAPKSVLNKRRLSNSSDLGLAGETEEETARRGKRLIAGSRRKLKAFCDPFDRELLVKRIGTFNVLRWTVEDVRLSPLECALNGWSCSNRRRNQLHCQGCYATILVNLQSTTSDSGGTLFPGLYYDGGVEEEQEEQEQLHNAIISSYVKRLHTDHYQGCVWRADNLDLEFARNQYYIHNFAMDRVVATFDRNIHHLVQNQQLILSMKSFKKNVVSAEDLKILKGYAGRDCNETLLTLAVTGWQLRQQMFGSQTIALLTCRNCTRRILLGKVGSSSSLESVQKLDACSYPPADIPNSADELEEEEEINLVEEHESWCCMVGHEVPGYRTVIDMLKSNSDVPMEEDEEDEEDGKSTPTFDSVMAQLRGI